MSWIMLKGKVFSALTSWLGILGSFLLIVYLVLVTFCPSVKSAATAFAAPGGLLTMAWMILVFIRLFKAGHTTDRRN